MENKPNIYKLAVLYTMAGCAFFANDRTPVRLLPGTEGLIDEIADWLKERAVANGETTWANLNDMSQSVPPVFKALDLPDLGD